MSVQGTDPFLYAGQEKAVALFHRAVRKVSAYNHFLNEHGFDARSVVTYADFQKLPVTSKENYIERYSLNELAWNGNIGDTTMVHSSSGTSGKPYYWPCSDDELKTAMRFYESVFRDSFEVGEKYKRTLLIVCFGMGTWIAGSYTTAAALLLRLQGLPMTIVTPGFNRQEALRLMTHLGGAFEQVILAGIPSFIKDLLDEWSPVSPRDYPKLRVLLAGEGFPESWREHVARTIGGDIFDVISLLGSADAGLIGFESNHSIALRNTIAKDAIVRRSLIHNDRVPALLHFDPCHRFLESSDAGKLLITADRTIPLIRYDTLDFGGILSSKLTAGVPLELTDGKSTTHLPLVYLFGRGAKSATIYGANIHAEWVQEFLVESSVRSCTSGRFQLETNWLPSCDQRLLIRIELGRDYKAIGDETEKWSESLATHLRSRSTEYSRISEEYGERSFPLITVHNYGCAEYFPSIQKKYS